MHYNEEQLVNMISNVFGEVVEPTFDALNSFYSSNGYRWKHTRMNWSNGVTMVGNDIVTGDVYNHQMDINYVLDSIVAYVISERPKVESGDSYW